MGCCGPQGRPPQDPSAPLGSSRGRDPTAAPPGAKRARGLEGVGLHVQLERHPHRGVEPRLEGAPTRPPTAVLRTARDTCNGLGAHRLHEAASMGDFSSLRENPRVPTPEPGCMCTYRRHRRRPPAQHRPSRALRAGRNARSIAAEQPVRPALQRRCGRGRTTAPGAHKAHPSSLGRSALRAPKADASPRPASVGGIWVLHRQNACSVASDIRIA